MSIKNTSNDIVSRNRVIEKQRMVSTLKEMPIVEVACQRAGAARATYYRWLKSDPEFAEKCREALDHSTEAVSDIAEAKLINSIREGNMQAISFWLRHHRAAYANKLSVNGTIRHEAAALTPEQEELVARALRAAGLMEGSND